MKTIVKCSLVMVILFTTSTTAVAQNPVLTSVTPNTAKQGQSLTVTITGVNTHFGPASICFEQATLTDGSFGQGTPTVTGVWLSQCGSTIDWTRGWKLWDTLFFALFDVPSDANVGKWDVHVNVVQGTPPTNWNLTLNDGFTITPPCAQLGDLTCDGAVNFSDVAVLSNHWLEGTE